MLARLWNPSPLIFSTYTDQKMQYSGDSPSSEYVGNNNVCLPWHILVGPDVPVIFGRSLLLKETGNMLIACKSEVGRYVLFDKV